jgi:uncharacterized protein (DUF305 family)
MKTGCNRVSRANTLEKCDKILRCASAVAMSVAVLLLLGCSDQSSSGGGGAAAPTEAVSGVAADVNQEDVRFARLMAPHHDQAISMCEMVLSKKRGVKPEVRDLAQQIGKVRESQIETLNGWIQSWDPGGDLEPAEDENAPHHGGHGLMTERQMQELDLADGPAAQKLFLEGMIRHHEGAFSIAEAEVTGGSYPDAVELAKEIVATQKAEIATMQQILTQF